MNSKTVGINKMHGSEPEGGFGVLPKQGGLQEDGLGQNLRTRRSRTGQLVAGAEKVLAQYPVNQQIEKWVS